MSGTPKKTEIQTQLPDLFASIRAAHDTIRDGIHPTPVLSSRTLMDRCGASGLWFKCENFQKTGSFKLRGATNAIRSLSAEEGERGVVAHSSGNHAQAVAYASLKAGIKARIVMPKDSSPIKIEATRGYGAEVSLCEPDLASRDEVSKRILTEHGSVLIHPFDDPRIIAGQGTAALEFLEEVPDLDVLLTPVSGGGLLCGSSITARSLRPDIQIIGCEPENADDAYRSFRSGKLEPASPRHTIADGLRATLSLRSLTLIRALVTDIVTVPEEEIVPAMRTVWERMKIVIEPSSAVVVAALLGGRLDLRGLRVGAILSGGNVDFGR